MDAMIQIQDELLRIEEAPRFDVFDERRDTDIQGEHFRLKILA